MIDSSNKYHDKGLGNFDVAIIGGGLAGLSASILLAKAGYKIVLFEKEKYPFHKVCGEYISMESWSFVCNLGLDLPKINVPVIKNLFVSSPNGNFITSKLDVGGFGVSRYFLDNELKKIAVDNGVFVREETKVSEVNFNEEAFTIQSTAGVVFSKVVIGSFGKRSNLDIKWKRGFIQQKPGKLDNYIGVKYHVKNNFPGDTIALHNFKNGYCGISKVEDDTSCLCYLTTTQNLKENQNSIKEMEKNVLFKNPFLKKIFTEFEFLFEEPVTISQISFSKKTQIENHLLLPGDAGGMITPLCGNGMSIAFHSAKIAFKNIDLFLQGKCTRQEMEDRYENDWRKLFSRQLKNGMVLQYFFGKESLTNLFIKTLKPFPFLISALIKKTHGKAF